MKTKRANTSEERTEFKNTEHETWWEKYSSAKYGLCWCGCEAKTNIANKTQLQYFMKEGKPNRYISGHTQPRNDNKDELKCLKCKNIKRRGEFYFQQISKYSKRKYYSVSACKQCIKIKNISKKYGLSFLTLQNLYKKQQGMCPICLQKLKLLTKESHIDHCHKTGIIRGILCARCNLGLGCFSDNYKNLQRAMIYLYV